VEEVCQDYETLELDIPGGDGETTLAQAIHGWILWEKRNILLKPIDQASRPSSPQPPPRARSTSPPSPAAGTTTFSFKGTYHESTVTCFISWAVGFSSVTSS
jgi:hypothetical protein